MLPVHTSSTQCAPSKQGACCPLHHLQIRERRGERSVRGRVVPGGVWQGTAAAPAWGHPWVLMGVGGAASVPNFSLPSPNCDSIAQLGVASQNSSFLSQIVNAPLKFKRVPQVSSPNGFPKSLS